MSDVVVLFHVELDLLLVFVVLGLLVLVLLFFRKRLREVVEEAGLGQCRRDRSHLPLVLAALGLLLLGHLLHAEVLRGLPVDFGAFIQCESRGSIVKQTGSDAVLLREDLSERTTTHLDCLFISIIRNAVGHKPSWRRNRSP